MATKKTTKKADAKVAEERQAEGGKSAPAKPADPSLALQKKITDLRIALAAAESEMLDLSEEMRDPAR